jgi:hypothetical protein
VNKVIAPQLKMLKLMISLVPQEKKRDVLATASQSVDFIDDDEEVKAEE